MTNANAFGERIAAHWRELVEHMNKARSPHVPIDWDQRAEVIEGTVRGWKVVRTAAPAPSGARTAACGRASGGGRGGKLPRRRTAAAGRNDCPKPTPN